MINNLKKVILPSQPLSIDPDIGINPSLQMQILLPFCIFLHWVSCELTQGVTLQGTEIFYLN